MTKRQIQTGCVVLLGLALVGSWCVTAGQVGGSVAEINEISAESFETDLSLDASGTDVPIASLTISDNHENAFELTLTFANGGKFVRTSAGTDGATVQSEIPMLNPRLVGTGGMLGSGLVAPSGVFALNGNAYTWDPGARQTSATVNYRVEIRCGWSSDPSALQGLYTETVTATLSVGDGT